MFITSNPTWNHLKANCCIKYNKGCMFQNSTFLVFNPFPRVPYQPISNSFFVFSQLTLHTHTFFYPIEDGGFSPLRHVERIKHCLLFDYWVHINKGHIHKCLVQKNDIAMTHRLSADWNAHFSVCSLDGYCTPKFWIFSTILITTGKYTV